jgi:hypothetical protein
MSEAYQHIIAIEPGKRGGKPTITTVALRTGTAFGSRARRGAEAPGSAARRPPPRPGCAGVGRLCNGSPAASAAGLEEELQL